MRCHRCQGRMIQDNFIDVHDDTGILDFQGWRCLNCGNIVDPVIGKHRSMSVCEPLRSARRWRDVALTA